MVATLVQRVFDPSIGGDRRASTAIGAVVGVLVGAASCLAGSGPSALLFAVASFLAVAAPAYFVLRGLRRQTNEMRDLWGLQGLVSAGKPWPAPGGWALSAGALTFLIDDVRRNGHGTVVELGPGVSSVVLAQAEPGLRLFGLEHDRTFVESVSDMLAFHGVDGYTLIHAPLKDEFGSVEWYSKEALSRLPREIDVLVVDGPPNWRGKGNRKPAWELLGERLKSGGIVLVDDTYRRDERKMANEWLRDESLELEYDAGEFMALRVVGPS